MESSLQDLEKVQLEDTSPEDLLMDCIEQRLNLKDTKMTEAADQFPEIPKQCSQDTVNIFVDEQLQVMINGYQENVTQEISNVDEDSKKLKEELLI